MERIYYTSDAGDGYAINNGQDRPGELVARSIARRLKLHVVKVAPNGCDSSCDHYECVLGRPVGDGGQFGYLKAVNFHIRHNRR